MIRKLVSYIINAVAAYTIIGFVIVPPLIHTGIVLAGNHFLARELKLGAVYFNPLTLNLSLIAVDVRDTIKLSSAEVDLSWKDLQKALLTENNTRQLTLDKIRINNPESDFTLTENGQNNFASLLKEFPEQPTSTETEKEGSSSSLQFTVNQIAIENGRFGFTDYQFTDGHSPFSLQLDQINIQGQSLGWPQTNSTVSFSTHLNGEATVNSKVDLALSGIASEASTSASISLNNINLTDFQPIVNRFTYVDLTSGLLDTRADINWQAESGVQLTSDVTINQLQLDDSRTQETVAQWLQLQLSALSYRQKDNRLEIGQLLLAAPSVVIAVDEKLQVNLASLVKPIENTISSEQEEVDTTTATGTETPEFSLAINRLAIENGAMDFSDRSFQPGFATPIVNLNGEIDGFDTRSKKPATIEIDGRVDRYAPVTIKGALNPSSPLDMTDLSMSFTNVELTTLTPYSGRFAGYSIQKGRLHWI